MEENITITVHRLGEGGPYRYAYEFKPGETVRGLVERLFPTREGCRREMSDFSGHIELKIEVPS